MDEKLAPVVIFVYNRLENTKQVVEALAENYLATETEVFVFSDAAKDKKNEEKVKEVREYLKSVKGFRSFNIIEREKNYYIEKNITEGVTEIINKYGKIIVLEDDGVSKKGFLTFVNKALDFYEDYKKIMHISTFTFVELPEEYNKTFFWRYTENTGGGWATWKDRWAKFVWFQSEEEALKDFTEEQKKYIALDSTINNLDFLKLNPIPWDICWNIAVVKSGGLAVNSPKPLIYNNGLYNGTHFGLINKLFGKNPFEIKIKNVDVDNIIFDTKIEENKEALKLLKDFYKKIKERNNRPVLNIILYILVKLRITKLLKRFFV